jgi:hypothetical protein
VGVTLIFTLLVLPFAAEWPTCHCQCEIWGNLTKIETLAHLEKTRIHSQNDKNWAGVWGYSSEPAGRGVKGSATAWMKTWRRCTLHGDRPDTAARGEIQVLDRERIGVGIWRSARPSSYAPPLPLETLHRSSPLPPPAHRRRRRPLSRLVVAPSNRSGKNKKIEGTGVGLGG